jgi:hypothetical protein
MEESKDHMGYSTPAMQLEDSLERVKNLLESKKVEWITGIDAASKEILDIKANIQHVSVIKNPDAEHLLMLLALRIDFLGTRVMLGKMALEINEVHERLANVEKRIEELKLVSK